VLGWWFPVESNTCAGAEGWFSRVVVATASARALTSLSPEGEVSWSMGFCVVDVVDGIVEETVDV
jgi:hypothetical protein